MVEYKDRLALAMGKNFTIPGLAEAMGLSRQAVKKIFDSKTGAFNAENNSKAARILNVRSDWLATGEEPMRVDPAKAGWPYTLFSLDEFNLLDEKYRREHENTLAGEIQRIKQRKAA